MLPDLEVDDLSILVYVAASIPVAYTVVARALGANVVPSRLRRAGAPGTCAPGVHILRYTFCSHLAMRGAPSRAIQELAGHQDLATTQRYIALEPGRARRGHQVAGDGNGGGAAVEK